MATVCLAKHFAETSLVITAISPSWCRTDMGGAEAPRSAGEGAEVIYHAATLPAQIAERHVHGRGRLVPWEFGAPMDCAIK